jgi:hypothetical protein
MKSMLYPMLFFTGLSGIPFREPAVKTFLHEDCLVAYLCKVPILLLHDITNCIASLNLKII